ncbi:uncharacterized protein MYCFIDRAFT_56308 [Pseudocercospora fijiensis CIRAD86]|uniref:Inositolphosphotransferase Aur1/Ipt1 domain-containing protein n=1 Tax=Pseudocercospora fijiensis (strain CIRAD86) TaxID=383855 RepID=M3BBQ7_PSEFD|nr:uncharacterized protein MYCFIDRAFT_56308 [Pseudocercospora fijiensis CIRAD86]EME86717.1 hypothetical protein MYCFIDRAFT_56308 [Pseudocercospora fijiensis CIRAD86]
MGGAGAFIEPLVVISLLVGGTFVNRETTSTSASATRFIHKRDDNLESGSSSPRSEKNPGAWNPENKFLEKNPQDDNTTTTTTWQTREISLLGWTRSVKSPNTRPFSPRLLSRVLQKLPFLVEVWYWALIYWIYQLARAFTAVTLVQGTVHTARHHALQVARMEQALGIFWEPGIQTFFLQYPHAMLWINRVYSFIHIPGTILFLIGWFYFTITARRRAGAATRTRLYQARRRTMAMCNLLAFAVFTVWPCMPPRLLSDAEYEGEDATEAKSYGFVDTVHGAGGESSVWTQNKFCNQYAAMPSLHFGYSALIGFTIATIPLSRNDTTHFVKFWRFRTKLPSAWRISCVALGLAYPLLILVAIIATANHFILDAVAGAIVCGVAWNSERLLLNLLPLEDYFLSLVRIHKPEMESEGPSFLDEKMGLRRSSDSF